jgi:hypothetical protein
MEGLATSINKLKKSAKDLEKTKIDPIEDLIQMQKVQQSMMKGGDMYKQGNVRTAVREFMQSEVKAGRLKLNETDSFRVREYSPLTEDDPIDVFRRYYGEDALHQIDDIAEVFEKGESFKHYEQLLRESVDPSVLTIKKTGAGKYDPGVMGPAEERKLMEKIRKDKEQKELLEGWEPDREPSAHGGIAGQLHLNRTGYFAGRLVKGYELGKAFWKLLKDPKKIRAAVDNIFPTGDYKYDAEMAAEALVELNPKVFGGKLIDDLDDATRSEVYGAVIGPIQQQALVISKMKKARATADEITKGVADVMQDTSKAGLARSIEVDNLKLEFPGITDDMINKILVDDNPQRIAEVKATMKEAMKMREKGMGSNEIIQMFRKTPRTKNAEGGLINILKL